ncbi:hypothetical protein Tco_1420623 [Tanacetum coccineum]
MVVIPKIVGGVIGSGDEIEFSEELKEMLPDEAGNLEAEQDNGNINRTQSMATLNEYFPQGTGSGSGPRYALTESPTIYVSLIEQFWQTASASTLENGDMEITAIIDGKVKGRKISQIDEDKGITLVQMSIQTQGRHKHDFEFITPEEDYTLKPDISTANVPVSTAGAEVSTVNPKVKTVAKSLVYIRISAPKRKDKGKAIMKEAEPIQKKTKLQLEQERLGLEEVLRLQEQLDEEERQRIARVHEEASTFNAEEWDNIQAQIEADEELAHRLQAQEKERYSKVDKARLLNMGSHTLQQLKKLSFNEVKELFKTIMKRVNTFTLMKSDDTIPKVVARSSKIDVEQELNQESSKTQKIGEGSEPAKESKDELS